MEKITFLVCDHCEKKVVYKETKEPSNLWLWECVRTNLGIPFQFCNECCWHEYQYSPYYERFACVEPKIKWKVYQ